MQEDTG